MVRNSGRDRCARLRTPPFVQTSHHGQVERLKLAWRPNPEDDTDFSGLLPPEEGEGGEGSGCSNKGSRQAVSARDGRDDLEHQQGASRDCDPGAPGISEPTADSGGTAGPEEQPGQRQYGAQNEAEGRQDPNDQEAAYRASTGRTRALRACDKVAKYFATFFPRPGACLWRSFASRSGSGSREALATGMAKTTRKTRRSLRGLQMNAPALIQSLQTILEAVSDLMARTGMRTAREVRKRVQLGL